MIGDVSRFKNEDVWSFGVGSRLEFLDGVVGSPPYLRV